MSEEQKDDQVHEWLISAAMQEVITSEHEDAVAAEKHGTVPDAAGKQRKRLILVLAPLLVILALVALPSVAKRVLPRATGISPEQVRTSLLTGLELIVQQLERYHVEKGEYPARLAVLGLPRSDSWDYTRLTPDRYVIGMSIDGDSLRYDSAQDARLFFAELRRQAQ